MVVVEKAGERVEKLVRLGDIFSVDETNLSNEMARQAGLYAYFAVQMANAERSHAVSIMEKEEEYATLDPEARDALARGPAAKVTEAMVKAFILREESYIEVQDNEVDAKRNYRLLRAICNALEMRATMLQSLGAHLRHELDMTGMNTKGRQYQASISDVKESIVQKRAK